MYLRDLKFKSNKSFTVILFKIFKCNKNEKCTLTLRI